MMLRSVDRSCRPRPGGGRAGGALPAASSTSSVEENMLKMGIVGAENTHCAEIAKLCNVERKVPCRVVAVWGETQEFAKAAATAGRIPAIVRDWREMLGNIDGVMIDHRHPKYHAEVARFYVENGVPCFVDKPFTFTLKEALIGLFEEKCHTEEAAVSLNPDRERYRRRCPCISNRFKTQYRPDISFVRIDCIDVNLVNSCFIG